MSAGIACDMNDILDYIERQEVRLWSFMEAQHSLKVQINRLHYGKYAATHQSIQLLEAVDAIMDQYETQLWPAVSIQLHLRRKLLELDAIAIDAMKRENCKVEIAAKTAPSAVDDCLRPIGPTAATSMTAIENATADANAANTCKYCGKTFVYERALSSHIQMHRGIKKQFPCTICEKSFKSAEALDNHQQRIHRGDTLFKCQLCDAQFASKAYLYQHKQMHSTATSRAGSHKMTKCAAERPFECFICHKRFIRKFGLLRHMQQHAKVNCAKCPKSFASARCLDEHVKLVHTSADASGGKCLCALCGKTFINKSWLKSHMLSHSGDKPYNCTQCDYKSASQTNLSVHQAIHSKNRPFKCQQCDKTFPWQSLLNRHLRRTHASDKPFACSFCDKKFTVNGLLQMHIRTHTGAKPFSCSHCTKKFRTAGQQVEHTRRIHLGAYRFHCDICKEGSFNKVRLVAHMYKHTGVMPFACEQCDEKFLYSAALNVHKKVAHSIRSTEFKCSTCPMVLKTEDALARHEAKHKCTVCEKKFSYCKYLKIHMRIHTGEMPYGCDICGRRFREFHGMTKHKRKHAK